MCVIAIKPSNVEMPSELKLKAMWDTNKDGAGYMYALDDKVYIEKGFMTYDDLTVALGLLKDKLSERGLTFKDLPMVMHFRITTHGGTSAPNTHPFPISEEIEHLKALDVVCKAGIAHNGVISTVDKETDISDTMVFIRDIMAPLYELTSAFSQKFSKLIKATIGYSRLAIMKSDGSVDLIGEFKESSDNDGLQYSNLNHEWKLKPAAVTPYQYHGRTYYDEYDEETYDYGKSFAKKSCDSDCAFVIGNKYSVKKEYAANKIHNPNPEIEYLTYHSPSSSSVSGNSTWGKFSYWDENGKETLVWRELIVMEPYVEKLEETTTPNILDNGKNNVGGKKNEETKLVRQNADRKLYTKVKYAKFNLIPVKKGTIVAGFANIFYGVITDKNNNYNQAVLTNKHYSIISSTGRLFYSIERLAYFYKQSDGAYIQLSKDVAGYEYLVDSETKEIYDYKPAYFVYAPKPSNSAITFSNVFVYIINDEDKVKISVSN
jgi:predicted glutamine amidotransferase